MLRTTTLKTLSVLALSGCIATPAPGQYLYGYRDGASLTAIPTAIIIMATEITTDTATTAGMAAPPMRPQS